VGSAFANTSRRATTHARAQTLPYVPPLFASISSLEGQGKKKLAEELNVDMKRTTLSTKKYTCS
jgi:hypothetical protein